MGYIPGQTPVSSVKNQTSVEDAKEALIEPYIHTLESVFTIRIALPSIAL